MPLPCRARLAKMGSCSSSSSSGGNTSTTTGSSTTTSNSDTLPQLPQHGCDREDARAVEVLVLIGNIRHNFGTHVPYEKVNDEERKRLGIPEALDPEELRKRARRWVGLGLGLG